MGLTLLVKLVGAGVKVRQYRTGTCRFSAVRSLGPALHEEDDGRLVHEPTKASLTLARWLIGLGTWRRGWETTVGGAHSFRDDGGEGRGKSTDDTYERGEALYLGGERVSNQPGGIGGPAGREVNKGRSAG